MNTITINGREIGPGKPAYIIAEMSANHNQDFDTAVKMVHAAKKMGADAIKLQTYTPDTITLDCRDEIFMCGKGTIWEGQNLHDLYATAYTPWEWQPKLKKIADEIGIDLFSSPFDFTAVEFLEEMDVPAYKVASFELVDIPLIKKMAQTGKPIIMSTGMATYDEIEEAVDAIRSTGNEQIALLKCTSSYPAPIDEMNINRIPDLAKSFEVPAGLSDHSMELAIPVAAVSLGGCIIEKHFTLTRDIDGPDSEFSLEPCEFEAMVKAVRIAERSLGVVDYNPTEKEIVSRNYRRSLFAVKDIKKGEIFTADNIRSVRPANGLHTRYYDVVLGKKAKCDVAFGKPLTEDMIQGGIEK